MHTIPTRRIFQGETTTRSSGSPSSGPSSLIEGLSPLELRYWLARGGPTPRSARQAHSLPLVRAVCEIAFSGVCVRNVKRAVPLERPGDRGSRLDVVPSPSVDTVHELARRVRD